MYDIEVLECSCGARIRITSAIETPKAIGRILEHHADPAHAVGWSFGRT